MITLLTHWQTAIAMYGINLDAYKLKAQLGLLPQNQDTVHRRIDSFKKGYLCGSPDLIINNLHKHYTSFCIQFKSPKGNGVL